MWSKSLAFDVFIVCKLHILRTFSRQVTEIAIKWLENVRKIVIQMGEKWRISSRDYIINYMIKIMLIDRYSIEGVINVVT